jgi:hypothetical protein
MGPRPPHEAATQPQAPDARRGVARARARALEEIRHSAKSLYKGARVRSHFKRVRGCGQYDARRDTRRVRLGEGQREHWDPARQDLPLEPLAAAPPPPRDSTTPRLRRCQAASLVSPETSEDVTG